MSTEVFRRCGGTMNHVSDLLGGVAGFPIGLRLRGAYFNRKLRRVHRNRSVRVRARAHPQGAPEWRFWRGAVIQRAGRLQWSAVIRRWRKVELSGAEVVGTRTKRSAADGDRVIIELANVASVDDLAVSLEAAPVIEELLRRYGAHAADNR
jgi:hypothetical protein